MIGFLGGTGPEGIGLALRLASAGESILIGSRDAERAAQAAEEIATLTMSGDVSGAVNEEVAAAADVLFITVPYSNHREVLELVRNNVIGKTVVDVVTPIMFDDGVARALPVAEGSAAQEAQAILVESSVAAAFHTVSARDLLRLEESVDSDVVVCADDEDARTLVMDLAEKIEGVRAIHGGLLENAVYIESFTALLVNINRHYKSHSAIRITGI